MLGIYYLYIEINIYLGITNSKQLCKEKKVLKKSYFSVAKENKVYNSPV